LFGVVTLGIGIYAILVNDPVAYAWVAVGVLSLGLAMWRFARRFANPS
jgi:hypothetical protein